MTIENLQLVNILVFIMAGLIIVETIMLVVTTLTLSKQLQDLDQNLNVLSQRYRGKTTLGTDGKHGNRQSSLGAQP
jgi:hypothetical protein